MVIQCCACKRIRQDEKWVKVTDPNSLTPHVSHGYCPECAGIAYRQFLELQLMLNQHVLPPAA